MNSMTGSVTLPRPPVRFVVVAALHVGAYFLISDALRFEWSSEEPERIRAEIFPEKPPDPVVFPDNAVIGEPIAVDPIPVPPPVSDEDAAEPVHRETISVTAAPEDAFTGGSAQPLPVIGVRAHPQHPLTQPKYPVISLRFEEEGVVELAIYVLRDGRIADVRVARSSGHPRLDHAAVEEARERWRLTPAMRGNEPLDAWGQFHVRFRIENR